LNYSIQSKSQRLKTGQWIKFRACSSHKEKEKENMKKEKRNEKENSIRKKLTSPHLCANREIKAP